MTIEEEIEILENALRGALLVPSECAFVNTQIIKICLDTLKTYESWEILIRHEVLREVEDAMYHASFTESHEEDGLQKWDGGNWIRYKLFENVMERLKEQEE